MILFVCRMTAVVFGNFGMWRGQTGEEQDHNYRPRSKKFVTGWTCSSFSSSSSTSSPLTRLV